MAQTVLLAKTALLALLDPLDLLEQTAETGYLPVQR